MTAPPPVRMESTEIGYSHILFMDIVGYSRLQIGQQKAIVQELQELVSATQPFMRAETDGSLIARPTGDGMALIFFHDVLAPLRCALEIAAAAQGRPHIALRMGINSGLITVARDINGNLDVHGDGIVMAQRVMDFGDAGHILLSKSVADMLAHALPPGWHLDHYPHCEIKHGQFIELYNLFTREYGQRKSPRKVIQKTTERLEKLARPASEVLAQEAREKQKSQSVLLALLAVLCLGGIGLSLWFSPFLHNAEGQNVPEKPIPPPVDQRVDDGKPSRLPSHPSPDPPPPVAPEATLTSLSPTSITAARRAFTLTASGSKFINGDRITWNGKKLATMFVSSTELKATVPASNIVKARFVNIRITRSKARPTSPLSFEIQPDENPSIAPNNPEDSSEFVRLYRVTSAAPKNGQLWSIVLYYQDDTGSHTATSGEYRPGDEIAVQFSFHGERVSVWAVIRDTEGGEITTTQKQEFTDPAEWANGQFFILDPDPSPPPSGKSDNNNAMPPQEPKTDTTSSTADTAGKTGDKPQ